MRAARRKGRDDRSERQPDVGQARGKPHAGRHDADDQVRLVVQRHHPSHHARVGLEPGPPETFADDRGMRGPGLVVLGPEGPAGGGSNAHRAENLRRDDGAAQALGLPHPREGDQRVPVDAEMLERLVEDGPVLEGRPRDRHLLPAPGRFVQRDNPPDVRVRIRPEHDRIGDAEDRGVGADAERECGDDDRRVRGVEPQRSRGVLEILPDRGHDGLPALSEHGRIEGDAALDLRQPADETLGFFRGERRALRVGEVLADFGDDLHPRGAGHAERGQPRPRSPRARTGQAFSRPAMRLMARTKFFQPLRWAASTLRPTGVSL